MKTQGIMNNYSCETEAHKACSGLRVSGFLCACQCHKPLDGRWPTGTWFQRRLATVKINEANKLKGEN